VAGRLAGVALTAFEAAFGALACGGGGAATRLPNLAAYSPIEDMLAVFANLLFLDFLFLSLAWQNGYVGLLTIIPGFGRSEVVMKFTQRC
jgi:hypothetical protein